MYGMYTDVINIIPCYVAFCVHTVSFMYVLYAGFIIFVAGLAWTFQSRTLPGLPLHVYCSSAHACAMSVRMLAVPSSGRHSTCVPVSFSLSVMPSCYVVQC